MAKSKSRAKSTNDATATNSPKPVRKTLASLGIGLVWGALHMPTFQGISPGLAVWLVDVLVAAVITRACLEVAGALMAWAVDLAANLMGRWSRS